MDSPHLDDLDRVLVDALAALRAVLDRDWQVPAAGLDWTVWETLEHVADDHFAYAAQIAVRTPETETYVPFDLRATREGGPRSSVFADPSGGNAGLAQVAGRGRRTAHPGPAVPAGAERPAGLADVAVGHRAGRPARPGAAQQVALGQHRPLSIGVRRRGRRKRRAGRAPTRPPGPAVRRRRRSPAGPA